MADSNLNNLQNIGSPDLNFSAFNSTTEIPQTMFNVVKETTGDLWFFISILGIFIFFSWLFYLIKGDFQMDVARTILISSTFCLIITIGLLVSDWINSILPLIWFSTIVFVSFIAVYSLKKRGK